MAGRPFSSESRPASVSDTLRVGSMERARFPESQTSTDVIRFLMA